MPEIQPDTAESLGWPLAALFGVPESVELGPLVVRLAIDLAAIAVLALVLSYRRHRRPDLVVLYTVFNVGLFAAVVVISLGEVAAAVGFGLFAVLSIIRLRSEPLANQEIAYFFAAVVLGLVTAIDLGGAGLTALLAGLVIVVPAVIDRPGLFAPQRRMDLTLELTFADDDALLRHLEERLDARVIDHEVLELDYVREITRVRVRVRPHRGLARSAEGRSDEDISLRS
jgi:hypothetical protein